MLVVADDAVRRMALFRLLEWAGHRATVVDTGRAALAMLATEPFDLVLLDASMPERDGYEILHQIRVDPQLGRLPVLMLASKSAEAGPWIEMGADDVLTEPFVPVVVRARINATLARKRLSEREVEHRGDISRIVEAVLAAKAGTLGEEQIDAISRRCDPLGELRRALRQVAAQRDQNGCG